MNLNYKSIFNIVLTLIISAEGFPHKENKSIKFVDALLLTGKKKIYLKHNFSNHSLQNMENSITL